MDATPEHVVEPEPCFSPSVFLDLPPTPHPHPDGDGNDDLQASWDDMVLPFIRRMLMEDEEDTDEYPDHPALLLAQQPFAQILSAAVSASTATHAVATHSASGSSATTHDSSGVPAFANATWPYDPVQLSQQLLWKTPSGGTGAVGLDGFAGAAGTNNNTFHSSPAIKSSSFGHGVTMDMVNLAFLKGMEDASRFLPTNNDVLNSNQKRPLTQGQVEMGADTRRNSKIMAPEPEETGEMVDQAALNLLSSCLKDIASLRITMGSEADKKITRRKKKKQQPAHEEAGDLHTLLLHCAEAVAMNDRRSAAQLLRQIRTFSSPSGDANQRLAHCFANGLEARLAGTGSQVYRSLVSRRTSVVEYLKAYQLYVDTCCFKIMLFRFSNITIRNAAMGRTKVHIVDYGIGYGLQWPVLLRRLGTFKGGPPEVRMTGIDLPQPGFRPSSRIQETGRRLSSYAKQFGVPFKFRGIAAKWETIRVDDLDIEPDEVLIVNSLTPCGYVMDDGVTMDTPSPRDVVLNNIRKMRPHVFILCIVNATYNSPFFITRFREALSYYSSIFDMLDATTPWDNELRLLVERDLYGQCALNIVACEGLDRVERPETYKQWQVRNHRAGLRQLPLDPCTIKDIRERVQSLYHKDFVVDIDQQWLLQGWKGRILYAMSTWVANAST